ncbi:transcriptional regulator, LuxR family [Conexibacter woesei DSM 14684]|uniref:Transcriptional regulator, LuxR family n=1 Tax=Conexibacter woesei (strain DSM 14684 / CCUG 47730 / CIP 108061 / JCM 11494 / NBRC 100937 / ID131577) TaxID=469383 RepID=D3F7H8_CONWI|nr:transcriptional regulator, LuxR family [Conexibacter woesei DSM 14684]
MTARIVERGEELRRIGAALGAAALGSGTLVVVEGPAGIGKSRLLAEACALAEQDGFQLLRARGGALERDLAYGAVRQLLERPLAALDPAARADVLGGAAALAAPALGPPALADPARDVPAPDQPAPGGPALGGPALGGPALGGPAPDQPALAAPALGEPAGSTPGPASPPDRRFGVEHGLFWCVANLAERGPLLLTVDDAHWVDGPSLRFVHYLARRVLDLPVALLVALRGDERGAEPTLAAELTVEPDAVVLRPQPLTADGVAAVLGERMASPVAAEFAASCHAAVRGNPFLLSELGGALVADGVRPTAEAAGRVRRVRPHTLARAILLRLARLPAGATELATAVAVLGDAATPALARDLARLDEPTAAAALDRLAAAQILSPALPLDFVHPIVREVVDGELGPAARADWHARAAALALAHGGPIEHAAPHLLWTTPAGDATTTRALRRAARGALDRGAPDIATRYLERALAEPPPADERAATLLELGGAGFLAGEPITAVKAHAREAVSLIDEPATRVGAWLLLSRLTAMDQSVPGAVAVLEEALADLGGAPGVDPEQLAALENELCGHGQTHPQTLARAVARMDERAPPAGRTPAERLALCNLASRSCFTGRSAALTGELALRALAGGKLATDLGPDSNSLHQVAFALAAADHADATLTLLDGVLAESRARGSVFGVAGALGTRSIVRYLIGALPEAEADGHQALAVPGVPPFVVPAISGFLALALVERGALDEADAVLTAGGCGPRLPEVLHMHFAFWARSRVRAAQGRPADALDDLAELRRRCERVELRNAAIPWRADAALLHARVGDDDAAARLAGEYDELARAWGTPRTLGIAARTRGLLAEREQGLVLLREAVALHESSPARLEHARSLLELGAALRREGLRAEAIEQLNRAAEVATQCGATVLAARAREELGIAGAVGRQHAFSGVEALTPSELRIARMAADGLTNRAIAETLFVTAKTVENHLGRTYAKLGIRSRTALADALGSDAAP